MMSSSDQDAMAPRRASRGAGFWSSFLVALGLTVIALSMVPQGGPDAPWFTDVLMSLGTAVLLFGPFYFLTRTLDRHIQAVRTETAVSVNEIRADTAASVSSLTDRVNQFQEDVDRRLADVAADVSARLQAERKADAAAFDDLRTTPSREVLELALSRAAAQGLTSPSRSPRVDVSSGQYLYVSVDFATEVDPQGFTHDSETLSFTLETISGERLEWIPWAEHLSTAEVMVEVGRAIQKHAGEDFDVAAFFVGLADLLNAASSSPTRRPAVQLCPPQWMVTTRSVVTYGDVRKYEIGHDRLTSNTIAAHVAEKTWSDADSFDEAHMVALALFPALTDEPPF